MFRTAHGLLIGWYFVGPVIALALAGLRARRFRRPLPLLSWLMTAITASVLGTLLAFIYAHAAGGRMMISQAALAAYFGAGLLFLLKGLDYALRWGTERLFGIPRVSIADNADPLAIDPEPGHMLRRYGAFVVRVGLLFALGLPYVMSAVMTYRARVLPVDVPTRAYETIAFEAADGARLSGWWIPANAAPADAPAHWGQRTLLLCHGLAANKSNHLVLGAWGPAAGYNVLSFDFRAHGQSSGQLTTFGDLESLDVLAAVRWLRDNKPQQSGKIFGIGASMGAAALITAAADPSPEGRAIDAVVVFGTYARLDTLAAQIADQHFAWPLDALVRHISIPLADLQTGRRLRDFAPAERLAQIWPRPVMIIHGMNDEVIPFSQGEQLAEKAIPLGRFLPIQRAGHNDIIENGTVTDEIRHFLDTAQPVPLI